MKYKSLFRNFIVVASILFIGNNCMAQLSPMVIGTINAGDSVVIYYDATINTGAGISVTNQGTITGSNFASLVTDDPKTLAPGDPTITLLNMFPLPVTLTQFKAYEKNNDIELAWNVTSEINFANYEIEKSGNGRTFVKIGAVTARGGAGSLDYTFLDTNPFSGSNFYRLKMIDIDLKFKYSLIVKVDLNNQGEMVTFYPNPVAERTVNLQMNNLKKGRYQFNLYNGVGQLVYNRYIDHAGGSSTELIQLPVGLSGGLYYVQLKGNAATFTKTLVVK